MKLTLQQLEAHLWGAANILRGKTAGQDYKNYILSLMFYKRLCNQWECEADGAIAELGRQQRRTFREQEKAVSRAHSPAVTQIPPPQDDDNVSQTRCYPRPASLTSPRPCCGK